MLRIFVLALMASAISLVASDSIQEAPVIQLASEFNVGFELVSKCTTYQYEAGERCTGREPFTFYGDSTTACQMYYWCSPEHGACTFTCSEGTVFDQACNCCKASTATASYDVSTCSSSSSSSSSTSTSTSEDQPSAVDTTATSDARRHRRILQVTQSDTSSTSSSSSSPSITSLDPQKVRVRARARLAQRRRRREAAAARAAASVGTGAADSITSNASNMANKPTTDGPSQWNQYGKKYKGPWEAKDMVKEPAFKSPSPLPTEVPGGAAELKLAGQNSASTALAAAAAVPEPAAGAVPDTRSSTAPTDHRVLLQQQQPLETDGTAAAAAAHAGGSQAGSTDSINRRQMQMKRVQPVQRLAAQAAAAAAASGDSADAAATADALEREANTGVHPHGMMRSSMLPMAKKPAAKQIDPDDEKEAPFAAAIAAADPVGIKERPVHVRRMRPGQVATATAAAPA